MTENYDEKNDFLMFHTREGNEFGQLSIALNHMISRIENDRKQLRETVASLEQANVQLEKTPLVSAGDGLVDFDSFAD